MHYISRFDFIWLLLSGYFIFAFTVLTNGWCFLLGNNSTIGFQLGCIISAILAILSIVRVCTGQFFSNKILLLIIVFFSSTLLAVIFSWMLVFFVWITLFS
jgi:hypothetical protein